MSNRPPFRTGGRITSSRVCVLQRSRIRLRSVRNDRLAKAKTGLAKLVAFGFRQFRIALREEFHGFRHPGHLIILRGANHAALADRAEQLIPSPIVCCFRLVQLGPIHTSFARQPSPPFLQLLRAKRKTATRSPGFWCEESPRFPRVPCPQI